MKRRGFLGSILGAAAAGPSVAKSIVEDASSLSGAEIGRRGYLSAATAAGNTPISTKDWRLREIDDLRKQLLGKTIYQHNDDREDRHERLFREIEENVDCLRSVSRGAKLRMIKGRRIEHRDTYRTMSIKNRIAAFLFEIEQDK